MPFIQARARFIHPNTGHTAIDHSPTLSVNKKPDVIIRVESKTIATSSVYTRTHFELNELVVVPANSYVEIFPILRTEINKTVGDDGLHLVANRYSDTIVNGRSVKDIAQGEIYQTWEFVNNYLNVVYVNTKDPGYGTIPLNTKFIDENGFEYNCTIVRQ